MLANDNECDFPEGMVPVFDEVRANRAHFAGNLPMCPMAWEAVTATAISYWHDCDEATARKALSDSFEDVRGIPESIKTGWELRQWVLRDEMRWLEMIATALLKIGQLENNQD